MKADFGPVDWTLAKLVLQNRVWKHNVDRQDPTFFKRGAEKQEPKVVNSPCLHGVSAQLIVVVNYRSSGLAAWTLESRSRSS